MWLMAQLGLAITVDSRSSAWRTAYKKPAGPGALSTSPNAARGERHSPVVVLARSVVEARPCR